MNVNDLLGDAPAGAAGETDVLSGGADEALPLDEELALRRMAAALSVFDGEAAPEQLTEQMNIVRLNRQAKTNNLAHRQALVMARAKKDPLYGKYAKFNGIRLTIREMIYRKYGAKAIARARQLMASIGTGGSAPKK